MSHSESSKNWSMSLPNICSKSPSFMVFFLPLLLAAEGALFFKRLLLCWRYFIDPCELCGSNKYDSGTSVSPCNLLCSSLTPLWDFTKLVSCARTFASSSFATLNFLLPSRRSLSYLIPGLRILPIAYPP